MFNISSIEYTPLILRAFSALSIYTGAAHIVRGIKMYPPASERVKLPSDSISTLDTNHRFLGGVFMGYGAMFAWTAYDIQSRQLPLNILLIAGALSGIGRIVSAATFGWGSPFARNAATGEVVLPAMVYWFGSRHYV
ncbi:hypothetical protein BKA59DRAFT_392902 [Fusarium tricinctum]|uniref:Uncharacterized protein n=1 Tax=Fusarium tricinctum TaxID=61284 RepID=A0A8K0S4J6_9HYPO|nr:hypothetical protein BKA59DRAFT_392902 [Fusarium tricinctum]